MKVRAYRGEPYNEAADRVALTATQNGDVPLLWNAPSGRIIYQFTPDPSDSEETPQQPILGSCLSDSSFPEKAKKRLIQSVGFRIPSRALLHQWGKEDSRNCPFCHEKETLGHVQSRCKLLEKPRIVAHYMYGRRFYSNFSASQTMRGMNTNGQYLLQFPQRHIRRLLSAKYSSTLISSPLMLHWRARYSRSSPYAPL